METTTASFDLQSFLRRYPIVLQLLRFVAIGVLNTALDFIILNLLTKTLNIQSGLNLGSINVVGFSTAVIQSYFWNRYWAFGGDDVAIAKNFFRLIMVGGLGAIGMIAVLFGAQRGAAPIYYLLVLLAFVLVELALFFYITHHSDQGNHTAKFLAFLVVSIIGLIINSVVLALVASRLQITTTISADLIKNLAKILATVISLVWNFIGYKLIVFRK